MKYRTRPRNWIARFIVVCVNSKTCDWSTQISLAILLCSHWSESVGGHQTSTVAVWMLQGSLVHVYTNWYRGWINLYWQCSVLRQSCLSYKTLVVSWRSSLTKALGSGRLVTSDLSSQFWQETEPLYLETRAASYRSQHIRSKSDLWNWWNCWQKVIAYRPVGKITVQKNHEN